MTTIYTVQMTCGICRRTSEQYQIGSTSSLGYPDLDTRPPELARSTLPFWIRRCYNCGYCAPDLSDEPPAATKEFVSTEIYRETLENPSFSMLANSFLARALIEEQAGSLVEAGRSALHAAWACDDRGDSEAATSCRERALRLFNSAKAEGQHIGSVGEEACVIADLMRRTSRFAEATEECRIALANETDDEMRSKLSLQMELAERRDRGPHTVGEAMHAREP